MQEMRQHNHGTYEEIPNEKDILKITTSTKLCVVHFFHKEFRRCQIIDKHLAVCSHSFGALVFVLQYFHLSHYCLVPFLPSLSRKNISRRDLSRSTLRMRRSLLKS